MQEPQAEKQIKVLGVVHLVVTYLTEARLLQNGFHSSTLDCL